MILAIVGAPTVNSVLGMDAWMRSHTRSYDMQATLLSAASPHMKHRAKTTSADVRIPKVNRKRRNTCVAIQSQAS